MYSGTTDLLGCIVSKWCEKQGILMTMIMQEANDVQDLTGEPYECDDRVKERGRGRISMLQRVY